VKEKLIAMGLVDCLGKEGKNDNERPFISRNPDLGRNNAVKGGKK